MPPIFSSEPPAPKSIAPGGRRPRTLVVTLIIANQAMQGMAMGGIALFLPLIREEENLTYTQGGSLSAYSTICYAVMLIPAGILADRYSARKLFLIGLAGINILSLVFATLHSYNLMVVNQMLSGIFRSLLFAPGLMWITSIFPPQRRATAMGLYVAGGVSSNVVLNFVGPIVVAPLGWRMIFQISSAVGLVLMLALWKLAGPGPSRGVDEPPRISEIAELFRSWKMWAIGGVQYVRLAVVQGLAFWMPTFIVADKGFSLQTAGLIVGVGGLISAPSNFLGGYVADRLRNPIVVIAVALTMLSITIACLAFIHNTVLFIAVCAINYMFVQVYFGPLFALPIALLGTRGAGAATGFGNFFANVGAFTFVLVLGGIRDQTGSFSSGLYALSALCTVALALTFFLWRAWRVRHDATPLQVPTA